MVPPKQTYLDIGRHACSPLTHALCSIC